MFCLYNGEYGEHDLSMIGGLESIMKKQQEAYNHYKGITIGDFVVLNVEYDWGKHDQRWEIECTLCHEKSYLYHANDWRRGKGRSTVCHCRKASRIDIERREKELVDYSKYINTEQKGCVIREYKAGNQYLVVCTVCGKERKFSCASVLKGNFPECTHRTVNDYSDPAYIGKKIGYLTICERKSPYFIALCDCGRNVTVRGTNLFRRAIVKSCGDPQCPFYQSITKHIEDAVHKRNGIRAEYKLVDLFLKNGYKVEYTKETGDYGVDFIVYMNNGHKMAVQSKMEQAGAGVKAIQEVYAGGRFYECDMFCVICPYGFTYSAKIMASKLKVYLAEDEFEYPENMEDYCNNLLQINTTNETIIDNPRKLRWDINGEVKTADEWCKQYHVSRSTVHKRINEGHTIQEALMMKRSEVYTVNGFTGTIKEIGDHFGIIPQTIRYRMKYRNMTISDAVFAK